MTTVDRIVEAVNYNQLAKQLESVQSFVRPDEMRLLYDLAQPGFRCVDLGVGSGKSTILMAARAYVLAVSLWHWPGEGDCTAFQGTLERFPDCAERITAICADTAQTGRQFAPFGPQFDVVFIDAGHQEHDVQADVLAWAPLLSSRGVLVFHDYSPRWVGVRTVVDRMCENGWECVQSVQSIRVLKKGH
jgi:predicted O-methyltransferase YrrM